jgi:prevent-host-death family protein
MSTVLDPIPIDAAPATFADAVARVAAGKERIILTRAGTPVVALVPIADLEAVEDAADAAAAADGLTEYERSGKSWPSYTVEELAARWGISLSDVATE